MKSLTSFSANRTRVSVRTVRKDPAGPDMISLTFYQANGRTRGRGVRKDIAGPGMESLTSCPANRTRVGVRKVRRNLAGPDMKSLTSCEANRARVGCDDNKKGPSWTSHCEITHNLSSQQDHSWREDSERGLAAPDIDSLTCCQINRARVGVRKIGT